MKEAATEAAATEKDRVVKQMKVCTEGPALMAVVENEVNAARMLVELKREVADSAMPVEIAGWQGTGGNRRKTAQVASQLSRPRDGEGRKALQEAVGIVQSLVGTASLR